MSRAIVCEDHGKRKPTHPEDAARGLFVRYKYGLLLNAAMCDQCGKHMEPGDKAVAISQPSTMGEWEGMYLYDELV
jgi:hypothetical protein